MLVCLSANKLFRVGKFLGAVTTPPRDVSVRVGSLIHRRFPTFPEERTFLFFPLFLFVFLFSVSALAIGVDYFEEELFRIPGASNPRSDPSGRRETL